MDEFSKSLRQFRCLFDPLITQNLLVIYLHNPTVAIRPTMPHIKADWVITATPGTTDNESCPGDDLTDDLRPEYDATSLKNGVRGKYLTQYRSSTNLVLLAPDVAASFPTEQSVNEALRRLMQLQEAA